MELLVFLLMVAMLVAPILAVLYVVLVPVRSSLRRRDDRLAALERRLDEMERRAGPGAP